MNHQHQNFQRFGPPHANVQPFGPWQFLAQFVPGPVNLLANIAVTAAMTVLNLWFGTYSSLLSARIQGFPKPDQSCLIQFRNIYFCHELIAIAASPRADWALRMNWIMYLLATLATMYFCLVYWSRNQPPRSFWIPVIVGFAFLWMGGNVLWCFMVVVWTVFRDGGGVVMQRLGF